MRSVTGRTGWIRIGEIIARAWRTEAGSWFQTREEAYRKNDLLFVQKMMCRWKSECDQRWRASVARRLNSDEVMQIGGLVGCYALSTCLDNTQYTVTPKTLMEFYVCCCNQKVWSHIEIKWSRLFKEAPKCAFCAFNSDSLLCIREKRLKGIFMNQLEIHFRGVLEVTVPPPCWVMLCIWMDFSFVQLSG